MWESILPAFLEVQEAVSIDAAERLRAEHFTNARDERSDR